MRQRFLLTNDMPLIKEASAETWELFESVSS
jgi:hypothetical protein